MKLIPCFGACLVSLAVSALAFADQQSKSVSSRPVGTAAGPAAGRSDARFPFSAVNAYLIGQGAPTNVPTFYQPEAQDGRFYSFGAQVSAGSTAPGDKVAVFGGAETGTGGSDVWGANFITSHRAGDPDVNVQGLEIDHNEMAADQPHNPAKLHAALNLTSGGTYHSGYALYIGSTAHARNSWRQGIYASYGAFSDTGINLGAPAMSGVYVGRQVANGGDGLLLQRATDAAPTGNYIRLVDAANATNLFSVGIDGSLRSGPSASGAKIHVSPATDPGGAPFTGLGIENSSVANSTLKTSILSFYGRDTAHRLKNTAQLVSAPLDANNVNDTLSAYVRTGDSVTFAMELDGNGLSLPSLSVAPTAGPGAKKGRLFFMAGTKTGTCKLMAQAGTSATPTPIADNIGSGC